MHVSFVDTVTETDEYACMVCWNLDDSLGLFMAQQEKVIACGAKLATLGMALRFVAAPVATLVGAAAFGLRGDVLRFAIIQVRVLYVGVNAVLHFFALKFRDTSTDRKMNRLHGLFLFF